MSSLTTQLDIWTHYFFYFGKNYKRRRANGKEKDKNDGSDIPLYISIKHDKRRQGDIKWRETIARKEKKEKGKKAKKKKGKV